MDPRSLAVTRHVSDTRWARLTTAHPRRVRGVPLPTHVSLSTLTLTYPPTHLWLSLPMDPRSLAVTRHVSDSLAVGQAHHGAPATRQWGFTEWISIMVTWEGITMMFQPDEWRWEPGVTLFAAWYEWVVMMRSIGWAWGLTCRLHVVVLGIGPCRCCRCTLWVFHCYKDG